MLTNNKKGGRRTGMKTEKILSIAAVLMIPFPLLLTALAGEYGAVLTPYMLPWLLVGLSAMVLGTIAGRWTLAANGKWVYLAKTAALLLGAFCVVFTVAAVFLCLMNSSAYIFLPLAMYLWYFFGYRNGQRRVLLNSMSLGGFCVEAALMFPLCDSACADSYVLLIVSAMVMVISMVVINRRQLERLSVRGKNEAAVISGASRRYNLKLTLLFAALIFVPFFFANWGADLLWELVKIIVRFLLSLFSFAHGDIEQGWETGVPVIPEMSTENDNLWLKILAAAIVTAGVILAVKPFIKAVKNLIRRIGESLGRTADKEGEEAFYTDYYEESGNEKTGVRGFKKAYREFLRERNPNRKYRLGYKAFMLKLNDLGVGLSPSDTTNVHRKACKEKDAPELADIVIDKYERLRYKDEGAETGDCEVIKMMLKRLGGKKGGMV